MNYVLHSCNGACHCYVYPNLLLFYPDNEQKHGNITIHSACDNLEKYEEVFEVTCNYCDTTFTVTGNQGWHIPTYCWEKV